MKTRNFSQKYLFLALTLSISLLPTTLLGKTPDKSKPVFRDFMGICVHTVMFKPELYKNISRHVRDYHDLIWDLGEKTDTWPQFPFANNRVDWGTMYQQWIDTGYEINASIMFNRFKKDKWVNLPRDAYTYGFALGRFFGPSNKNLVTAIEIGNEPGELTDETYKAVFENMAKGIRIGDPKVKIVTCAATTGPSERYAKSLDCFKDYNDLYDVINFHSYAQVKGWPTWERSFPEDKNIEYLKKAKDIIDWRNKNAPGKEIWITEFGWDASSKPAPKEGNFKDWIGSTELQQAQYLVRSYMIFSTMDLDRAYMYWFNDKDEPQVHGSSGLTRNYTPKPAYYAVSHLYTTLADYHFNKVLMQTDTIYAFEFIHGSNPDKTIVALWSPTGSNATSEQTVSLFADNIVKAEISPLKEGPAPKANWKKIDAKHISLTISETPIFITLEKH